MKPGLYQHYKGKYYQVTGVCRHSETLEEFVVYKALYGEGGLWVRPLVMFMEEVLVEGVRQPRFKYISSQKFDLLKNHIESIPAFAKIWQEEFGKVWLPDISLEKVVETLTQHLNDTSLPLTWVALDDHKPIGMCSLRVSDGIRKDLTPWLGPLVINAEYQNEGVGKILMELTKQKAADLGFKKLYLFIFDPLLISYYTRFGWKILDEDQYKGRAITIMESEVSR